MKNKKSYTLKNFLVKEDGVFWSLCSSHVLSDDVRSSEGQISSYEQDDYSQVKLDPYTQ